MIKTAPIWIRVIRIVWPMILWTIALLVVLADAVGCGTHGGPATCPRRLAGIVSNGGPAQTPGCEQPR